MKTDKTQMPENTNNGVGRLNKLAYRDGYIHETGLEVPLQPEKHSDRSNIRKNEQVAGGLLLGVTITVLSVLLGGTFFFLTHPNQPSPTSIQSSPTPKTNQPY